MKEKKTTFYYIMTFLGILVLSCGAGFILGKFIGRTEKAGNLQTFVSGIITFCIHAAPIVFLILSISGMFAAILTYLKCKKQFSHVISNEEDEEAFEKLEDQLNIPLLTCNILQILTLFFFICLLAILLTTNYVSGSVLKIGLLAADLILVFLTLFLNTFLSHQIVEIEKKLNPEKEGNALDPHFNKKWYNSFDEAQKSIACQAAYYAFQNINNTCVILLALCILGIFVFHTGIYPALMVCIIWMVSIVSYSLKARELERHK